MRSTFRTRAFGAILLVLALVLAACGGGDDEGSGEGTSEAVDGPAITVSSFNFPESTILAEIYAQALEANGYTVERNLNLGSRELIFPEIEAGNIDLLPEYVSSALQVGFDADAPGSLDDGIAALDEQFGSIGMVVLEPAPGEDKNVFVVTQAFSDDNGVTSLADLGNVDSATFGGPPECEDRDTCFAGLVDTYGLSNLTFESIQEGSARVAALDNGEIDVSLLFSTQPVINEMGFVPLDDPEGLIAPENIVPVVSQEVADAYGDDMVNLMNDISGKITTDVLLDLNGRVELEAQNPDEVATAWLTENGYIES
jgi:osmoprotectant transport system substrate-binding protein